MKHASSGLIAYLNGLGPRSAPLMADLLTIIQQNGNTTRLTSAPVNVVSTSFAISFSDATLYTFVAGGVTFTRSRVTTKVGLEVADLRLTLAIPPGATLQGVPWPQAVREGALDGAQFTLERVYMQSWGDTSLGTQIVFKGYTGEVPASRSTIDIQVKAGVAVLSNQMPRRLWQPGCLHVLYDGGCTLLKSAFTTGGAVAAGSTLSAIATTLTQPDHYFELGQITFTSGALAGVERTVKGYITASGVVTVAPPLPALPGIGDTFTIFPGCDKTQQTCTNKFANAAHFAGFPYVPVAEAAL
jgi:uncharacterized phage protein (TIGR02218 family)